MFLRLIEILAIITSIWTILFQIIVPLIEGRLLFPIFNKERSEVEVEIAKKKEDRSIAELREVSSTLTKEEPNAQ